VFIARAEGYNLNLKERILNGCKELGISTNIISGKRILLKPNLVEPHRGIGHINTHPLVVRAAAEAFLHLGAARVLVAEGSGHRRDAYLILENSGFADILAEDALPFIDLNNSPLITVQNQGRRTRFKNLVLPRDLLDVDIIVSMPKLKTHHWVGVTLAMKNLFGVMPGAYYGWPKNLLHIAGIENSILDIAATVKPQLSIVDGIVGMEGDGPICGTPVESNVLIMGSNIVAVDATCARIMGLPPEKISYLRDASQTLGPVRESEIEQRGETIASVMTPFKLLKTIPAHQALLA
jgi:uncharacterized protein (DUF362 family)